MLLDTKRHVQLYILSLISCATLAVFGM